MTADLPEPNTSAWPWPASLDALSAAPRHHTLLLENDRVRVVETRIPPGDIVPVHTHCWPSVLYVLSWSDFVRCDATGTVVLDSRMLGSPPSVAWSEALPPHSLENVGGAEIRVISVEIKPPGRADQVASRAWP
jgi:quercetin dioxygenase-like cupin family protein